MLILVPIKGGDLKNACISTRAEAQKWLLVDFSEGELKSADFYNDPGEIENKWIDYVVLENSFENYMDFMEDGSMVLVRRAGQESIDEIIEAFKFKELDEIGF